MEQDVRWKQRFENYEKALSQLKRFIDKGELNEFEEQGLIQCFEYTYELAWSLMKDYLTFQGIVGITGSRDAIRQAFNKGLISHGDDWMSMVEDRIISVHTYNMETTRMIEERIYKTCFRLFSDFYSQMKTRL
ncbi:nucleotidyltransferase substrate binding protein [Imperialibacter roseus]|uniref:Nucleotidyltransferase substrate binding protein n=1 Tax=Imperialibacter roseus TaxID=1324217 RepID=A0ABZ0IN99_9BACT|nr:nucleotidyltransferase substrate binding protein [Imperialibacter roseus]WOK05062.1 nucleotidyltransferase substrate binding protein [Imperialibacter roseus]